MGNSEEEKPSKSETPPSPHTPVPGHNNIPVYGDWAAMQAYYGPRLAVPPYHNSVTSSPIPPPYMWAPPQSMIPPYSSPYAAFYTPYPHAGVHLAAAPMSMEPPVKSSSTMDGGFVKKLKEFDGLSISIGNGSGNSTEDAADNGVTHSEETEDASDGSNGSYGVAIGAGHDGIKKRHQRSPSNAVNDKARKQSKSNVPVTATYQNSDKTTDVSASVPAKPTESMDTSLQLKDGSSPVNAQQLLKSGETWLQNEREVKRERRKQSNRESARRSRLRKQAEYEELAIKVQALTSENMTLKTEMNKLMNSSEKLKIDNATLMEKLKEAQLDHTAESSLHKVDDFRQKPDGTVNLLARVNETITPMTE